MPYPTTARLVACMVVLGLVRPTEPQDLRPLTNLAAAAPGVGLPDGWDLRRPRGVVAPLFAVTEHHALRIEAASAAGFALYQLPSAIEGRGALRWRWRSGTPIAGADLRSRRTDDSPARVMVAFADGRSLFYSWGSTEPRDTAFPSWTSDDRIVIVAATSADADGNWRSVCRDPDADYRRAFGTAPPPIVTVGVSADTEQLDATTWAEVGELAWTAGTPAPCADSPPIREP